MNPCAKVLGALIALGTLALGCSVEVKADHALDNIAVVASDADTLVLRATESVAQVTSRIVIADSEIKSGRWYLVFVILGLLILHNIHLHFRKIRRRWAVDGVDV